MLVVAAMLVWVLAVFFREGHRWAQLGLFAAALLIGLFASIVLGFVLDPPGVFVAVVVLVAAGRGAACGLPVAPRHPGYLAGPADDPAESTAEAGRRRPRWTRRRLTPALPQVRPGLDARSVAGCNVLLVEHMFDHPAPVRATSTPVLPAGSTRGRPSVGSSMRRYDDPVETRMGLVSGMEGPEQFLWRGRLWKVRAVLAHWVETGPWWQSGGARAVIGSDDAGRRAEREPGRARPSSADLPGGARAVAGRGRPRRGPADGATGGEPDGGRRLRPRVRLERRALGARRLRGLR